MEGRKTPICLNCDRPMIWIKPLRSFDCVECQIIFEEVVA